MIGDGPLHLLDAGGEIFYPLHVDLPELIYITQIERGVGEQALAQIAELMAMMDIFHGLFEAYGYEEADDDGGDVDEEVAPGAGGMVWRVDV
jgi:hypothetical protein